MKTTSLFIVFSLTFCSGVLSCKEKTIITQESAIIDTTYSWTENEKQELYYYLISKFKNYGEEEKIFCNIFVDIASKRYVDSYYVFNISESEYNKLFIEAAKKLPAGWSERAKRNFLINCKKGAIDDGMNSSTADEYCSCTLEKLMVMEDYKNPFLADINSESNDSNVLKIAKECLREIMLDDVRKFK